LNGKAVWHVVTEPYSKATHLYVVGAAPQGAKIARGAREAYKTITQLSGRPPRQAVELEGGAVDPTISGRDGKIQISFKPDRKYRRKWPKIKEKPTDIAPDIVETRKRGRRVRHIKL